MINQGISVDGDAMWHLLTALVLGMALGFTLQRGSFCGAALISSVVLEKNLRGMAAILVAILVSMAGFGLLAGVGWIIPNPSPMRLLSAVAGGILFGVGMVLAGGCVTGNLYKAAEGRLSSVLALLGIGLGATIVDSGALAGTRKALLLASRNIKPPAGLYGIVGMDYAALAAPVGVAALLLIAFWGHRLHSAGGRALWTSPTAMLKGSWTPMTAGAIVGLLGWLAYLSSGATGRNYPLGGISGVKEAFSWLLAAREPGSPWMICLVSGIMLGSAFSARTRAALKLRSADPATLLVALAGGVLAGAGAAIGRGCFIGNMISGVALLSLHSALFALVTLAANWITTLLYLRGLK